MKELEIKLCEIAGRNEISIRSEATNNLVRCVHFLALQIEKHGEMMNQQSFIEDVFANALYILEGK